MLRIVLRAVYAAAGSVLIAWTFTGPFHLIRPVSNPLNAEGILALSFLLLTLFCSQAPAEAAPETTRYKFPILITAVLLCTGLAFIPAINNPLLHDAYIHVHRATTQTWAEMVRSVVVYSPGGDDFFRPLGYLSYWLDARWAGINATAWNLWNLGVHLANTGLVWLLARRLSRGITCATVAALIFGVHGVRPEVVAWVGGRFDLLATLFTLAALLSLSIFVDTGATRWYGVIGLCAFCAFLSKESAYCLPLLALLLIPFYDATARRRILSGTGLVTALCVVTLAYRTWFLGGIGGYKTASGAPSILQFHPLLTLKALLFRQWAILLFPINWSAASLPLKLAVLLMVIVAAVFPLVSRASRKDLTTCLLWVIAAALPVQHMLLIGTDLNGSRVFYLPVLGLALFWGFLTEGCRPQRVRYLLICGLLLFQVTALEHNLAVWRGVALLAQRTCRQVGAELSRDPRNIAVRDLPPFWQGVYFLHSGFPQCVALNIGQNRNTGQNINRVSLQDGAVNGTPGVRLFSWNDVTQRLDEIDGQ